MIRLQIDNETENSFELMNKIRIFLDQEGETADLYMVQDYNPEPVQIRALFFLAGVLFGAGLAFMVLWML